MEGDEIVLDVGGCLFKTTRRTLSKSELFGRLIDNNSKSSDQVFIDRDGRLFDYILQYMRDGDRAQFPKDRTILTELRTEADFYNLPGLIVLIDNLLNDPNRLIRLSIGGQLFPLRATTLSRAPKESLLYRIATVHNEAKIHETDSVQIIGVSVLNACVQGEVFIDRDGSLFSFIVDYLRNGEIVDRSGELQDRVTLAKLEQEARFYSLPSFWTSVLNKVYPYRRTLIENPRIATQSKGPISRASIFTLPWTFFAQKRRKRRKFGPEITQSTLETTSVQTEK